MFVSSLILMRTHITIYDLNPTMISSWSLTEDLKRMYFLYEVTFWGSKCIWIMVGHNTTYYTYQPRIMCGSSWAQITSKFVFIKIKITFLILSDFYSDFSIFNAFIHSNFHLCISLSCILMFFPPIYLLNSYSFFTMPSGWPLKNRDSSFFLF